jgi:hypothetical protein
LNEVERVDTLGELTTWSLVAGAGVLSVVLALTVPPGWVGVPGWAYMILPAVMPLHGRRVSRRRRRGLERES